MSQDESPKNQEGADEEILSELLEVSLAPAPDSTGTVDTSQIWDPPEADLVGAVLDRYEILEELGRGAMGVVYKGRHKLIDRLVAIKVLSSQLVESDSSRKRFEMEAKAAGKLSHPNLISVFDYGFGPEGEPYLVMDFLDGMSLDALIKKKEPLPLERFIRMFSQACLALRYIHKRNLIHRDLKPSNIMVVPTDDDPELIKLVDFGIAKVLERDDTAVQNLTATGQSLGSPLYMSPEQCMGKKVDSRSDIYSLGCVMFQTLTGVPPIQGENALQTLFAHVNEKPRTFKDTGTLTPVPSDLMVIVMKTLLKDPEKRYQSASELLDALKGLDRKGNAQARPSPLPAPSQPDAAGQSKGSHTPYSPGPQAQDRQAGAPTPEAAPAGGLQASDKSDRVESDARKAQTPSLSIPTSKKQYPLGKVFTVAAIFTACFASGYFVLSLLDKRDDFTKTIAPAMELYERDDFSGAAEKLEKLVEEIDRRYSGPTSQRARAHYWLALALLKSGADKKALEEHSTAQEIFEELKKKDGKVFTKLLVSLGKELRQTSHYEESAAAYRAAVAAEQESPSNVELLNESYVGQANALIDQDPPRLEEARKVLEKMIAEKEPNYFIFTAVATRLGSRMIDMRMLTEASDWMALIREKLRAAGHADLSESPQVSVILRELEDAKLEKTASSKKLIIPVQPMKPIFPIIKKVTKKATRPKRTVIPTKNRTKLKPPVRKSNPFTYYKPAPKANPYNKPLPQKKSGLFGGPNGTTTQHWGSSQSQKKKKPQPQYWKGPSSPTGRTWSFTPKQNPLNPRNRLRPQSTIHKYERRGMEVERQLRRGNQLNLSPSR